MPDVAARLAVLDAEAAVRRLAARYMALCDEPPAIAPGPGFHDLFTADLIWEGVGRKAGTEFARVEGRDRLIAWFDSLRDPPRYIFNVHFLTSESIAVAGDRADGTWVMFQAARRHDGVGEVRMARIAMRFRRDPDDWRIAHFRTESLFRHDLAADQLAAMLGAAGA